MRAPRDSNDRCQSFKTKTNIFVFDKHRGCEVYDIPTNTFKPLKKLAFDIDTGNKSILVLDD